ncbi:glycosyltransferase family 4 protein [uncultured Draconibacterium sp.]|uniref:glycosyltransferase family 4 protein n=1 Tax=uncultured Draconibacterium sp. TaxID=1573823 RepID=UPI002AA6F65F|nr:glycosyltransferase family 4 protein [uncultured Draconibacterium sp.]
MNIIIIGNSAGSILGFRLPLIVKLLSNGHSVTTFANDFTNEDILFLKNINVKAYNYKLDTSGINPVKEIKTIIQLYKIFKTIKPDVVFSYFSKPVIYSSIAAKLIGVKTIVGMIEGLGITYTIQPEGKSAKQKILINIQSTLYFIVSFCIDKLIVLNNDDELFFYKKFSFKNIINIGGIGVDLNEFAFSRVKTEPFNFIFIGRLLREKGIFNFLQAAEKIKIKFPHITFTVLGSIDKKNKNSISQELLNQYIAKGIINYPGLVANVKKYIENSTVFVLPSYYREGLPRSTQEALAIGRPVITTNGAGCSETVVDNLNGKLVDLYNLDSLYNAMVYMINNTDKLESMGKESRLIAENKYDIEKINSKIINILVDQ